MIKAVILDWSGVLSDDYLAVFETANDVLEARGYPRLSMKKFKQLYEQPWTSFYKKQGIRIDVEDEYKKWERLFPMHYDKVKPFPMTKTVLLWLKRNGKKVLIFSAHNQNLLEKEVADYGLDGLIDDIDASNDDKRKKIEALIATHKIEGESTIYVGDTVHDIETAKQAGVLSVAVLCGYDSKGKLEKAKPDFIIKDVAALPALIEKIESDAHG